MATHSQSIPSKNARIEEAPLQNELMLFDPESSKFFVLNSTMAYLWRNADGTKSLNQITLAMIEAFRGADPAAVASDLARAADELFGMGLLIDRAAKAS